MRPILLALRPAYWLKNALVFVPLLQGRGTQQGTMLLALGAVVAFSLAASSAYVLNDVLDVGSDRQHPVKRHRPFASGALDLRTGLLFAAGLAGGATLAGVSLAPRAAGPLAAYLVLSSLYSLGLKHVFLADVFTLGALYTLRIVAGGVATGAPVSNALVIASVALFAALAIGKRLVELRQLPPGRDRWPGRPYHNGHRKYLRQLAVVAGCASLVSVLVAELVWRG
ncbi:MAG: hypothetical protein DMD40_15305 [Gemmatimonadetes bacterium]|nr:MAG: hypothetical protein DMD40_15305 [Gemmatimonadota bacterium]